MTREEKYMLMAIEAAKHAAEMGEVPVGAVVVYGDEVIATAFNTRESDKCATSHAELRALEEACRVRGGWRLFGCELYVTLEPCVMCAGAAVNARVDRVIYGASDIRFGALGSALDVMAYPLNHKYEVVSGVLGDECRALLSDFFKARRVH
ncbi:MAG: tRNA adenosine(34) deaminase TadA [Clostridia bacterium]|nr:tRNA adenosine(34) deaminase TadA [Clostridia bacterium]